jgi:hypothetical protein
MLLVEESTWLEVIINEEVAHTLRRSDLDKLLELIHALPHGICAADQLGLDQDRVATVLRSFYAALFSTISYQHERLQDSEIREKIRQSVAQQLANSHAKVI